MRQVVERIALLDLDWIHAMHGGSPTREVLPGYLAALRQQDFAYRGLLLGREVPRER